MNILISHGADILVILASLGAMAYCMVLSRRLSRLTSFDKGLGSAIAVMSSQVDEMRQALREAKAGSDGAGRQLDDLVTQAREISSELEMMIAACHDFAEEAIEVQGAPDPAPARHLDMLDIPEDADGDDLAASAPSGARRAAGLMATRATTPVFGSRRTAGARADTSGIAPSTAPGTAPAGASVEPLFRHRSPVAG